MCTTSRNTRRVGQSIDRSINTDRSRDTHLLHRRLFFAPRTRPADFVDFVNNFLRVRATLRRRSNRTMSSGFLTTNNVNNAPERGNMMLNPTHLRGNEIFWTAGRLGILFLVPDESIVVLDWCPAAFDQRYVIDVGSHYRLKHAGRRRCECPVFLKHASDNRNKKVPVVSQANHAGAETRALAFRFGQRIDK